MTLLHQVARREAGYLLITDKITGKTLFEAGLRQCVHCQYTWQYRTGSGLLRGFCRNCMGHTCGRAACDNCYHKEQQIEDIEAVVLMNRHAIEAAIRQQALREQIASNFGSNIRR